MAWRLFAPWGSPEQVEQDLVLLLNAEQATSYSVHEAYRIGISSFVEKMKGEPWKNDI